MIWDFTIFFRPQQPLPQFRNPPAPTTGATQIVYLGGTLNLGRRYNSGPEAPSEISLSTSCYGDHYVDSLGSWRIYLDPELACGDDEITVTRYQYLWENGEWQFLGLWDLHYKIIQQADLFCIHEDPDNLSGYAMVDGNYQVILQARAMPDPGVDCAPLVRFEYELPPGGTHEAPTYLNPQNGMRYSNPMLFDFSEDVAELGELYQTISFHLGQLSLNSIEMIPLNYVHDPLGKSLCTKTNNIGDYVIFLSGAETGCRFTEPFYLSVIGNDNNETPLTASQGVFPIVCNRHGFGTEAIRFIRYEPGCNTPTPDPSWTSTPLPYHTPPTPVLKINIGEKPKELRVVHRNGEKIFRFV